jgi:hypothetical protein
LIALEAHARERALEQFRADQLVFVMGGYKEAPKVPDLLRE